MLIILIISIKYSVILENSNSKKTQSLMNGKYFNEIPYIVGNEKDNYDVMFQLIMNKTYTEYFPTIAIHINH